MNNSYQQKFHRRFATATAIIMCAITIFASIFLIGNVTAYAKTTAETTISAKATYKVSSVKLSSTSYVYDGKQKTPSVTAKNSNGKTLKKGTDYTVKYSSSTRKNAGTYKVTVKFKGKYSGSKTLSFKIIPKSTSVSKVTSGANSFTVSWNKNTTQTTGYQIRYSRSSDMSNSATATVNSNKTTSKKISNLKASSKYYVQIRTYKTVTSNGKSTKYYSSWSSKKSVNTYGITLNKSSATMDINGSLTLKATATPSSSTVKWSSSNSNVAKVSSGKVTALNSGTATIRAYFTKGNVTYSATCKITVRTPEQTRYSKIVNYINKNGDIEYTEYVDDVAFFYSISVQDDKLFFFAMESAGNVDIAAGLSYDGYSTKAPYSILYYYNDEKIAYLDADIPVRYYNGDYEIDAEGKYNPSYISEETLWNIADNFTPLAFATWDEMLESTFGYGLDDIGFRSYYR